MENLSAELQSGTNITTVQVGGYPTLARWALSECIDWLVRDCVHAALGNLGRLWRWSRWTHGHKSGYKVDLSRTSGRSPAAEQSAHETSRKRMRSCVARDK
jgi:hypothetical protein